MGNAPISMLLKTALHRCSPDRIGNRPIHLPGRTGMRTRMTTSAGTTYLHYDENKNVSFETDASGQVVSRYTFDGENRPVSMTRDGQTYYFQLNGQGDVIALTDANGNVVSTYAYDAYGRITAHTGTIQSPYLYRGYRYDWETGFYYLQSRYYNPETGRFLTRDHDSGEEMELLTLNKYIYAGNNPVMNVDPNGERGIKVRYVAIVIDIALVAWSGWQWNLSRRALNRLLRKNFGRITRLVRGRFMRKHYSKATKFWGTVLNFALALSGNSVGQLIAKAMDRYLDPRLGYRRNNGRIFG